MIMQSNDFTAMIIFDVPTALNFDSKRCGMGA